jgi:hypothetical protein
LAAVVFFVAILIAGSTCCPMRTMAAPSAGVADACEAKVNETVVEAFAKTRFEARSKSAALTERALRTPLRGLDPTPRLARPRCRSLISSAPKISGLCCSLSFAGDPGFRRPSCLFGKHARLAALAKCSGVLPIDLCLVNVQSITAHALVS